MVLAAIAVTLLAVWLVARSLIRPLRTLRDSALRVAHTDLEREIARVRAGDEHEPEPLPVYTTEEVGQVAHAVDELHAQALLLAGDEARLRRLVNEMFETMSRRNRSLVDQQLALIDELERDERDADRLESLFRLDHLATRMRRTGANLLVLAGAQANPERGPAVSLANVISAAAAEVEGVDLTAGRRLQLACEKHGATGFMIRRRPYGGAARKETAGSAAATRWKITPAPSEPGPGEFGLGPPRWRVELERCRGGRTGAWLLEAEAAYTWEAENGPHPLRLVAELGDRQLAPAQRLAS